MFGFSAGTMFMGGGGSSGGGGGGIGAPGSDVGRGGGGRAGSSSSPGGGGGRGDNDRGPGTNPGRPGGESGMRGSSGSNNGGSGIGAPGSDVGRGGGGRAGSSDSGASTNPGRPGGESGMRGAGSSSGTNNESVSGSGRARDNFSVTNRSSSNMMSFGSRRDANVGTVGGFRGTRSLGGQGNSSMSDGLVTGGSVTAGSVDPTSRRTGPVGRASVNSLRDQAYGEVASFARNELPGFLEQAQDDGLVRDSLGFISPILGGLETVFGDTADNKKAAKAYTDALNAKAEELGISLEDTVLENDPSAIRTAIRNAQFPFANQESILSKATVKQASEKQDSDESQGFDSNNRGGGGGNDEPIIPPVPTVPAPTQPSESEEAETGPYGGSLGDYSSYARRFFSRV